MQWRRMVLIRHTKANFYYGLTTLRRNLSCDYD